MKKRVLCLIGAVALVLSVFLAVPVSAEVVSYEPVCILTNDVMGSVSTDFNLRTLDGVDPYTLLPDTRYYISQYYEEDPQDYFVTDASGDIPSGSGCLFEKDGTLYSVEITLNPSWYDVGLMDEGSSWWYLGAEGTPFAGAYTFIIYAVPSGDYGDGYDAGYSDGYDEGYGDGYDAGYDAGLLDGADADAFDIGYQAGLTAGMELGRTEGYAEGLAEASRVYEQLGRNLFSYATVTAHGYIEALDEEFTITVTPQLISDGVSFSSVYTQILDRIHQSSSSASTLSSLTITFTWDQEHSFDYGLLSFLSNAYIPDFSISNGSTTSTVVGTKDINNNVYTYRRFTNDDIVYNYLVRSVRLSYPSLEGQSLEFLNTLQLYAGGPYFSNGYAAGYSVGVVTSSGAAFEEGAAEGWKNGYAQGKVDAIEITKNGDWYSLMGAVVDTPVNAVTSLLSFEVLGMDMRVAFGSVLGLCVVLFIVKKVIL